MFFQHISSIDAVLVCLPRVRDARQEKPSVSCVLLAGELDLGRGMRWWFHWGHIINQQHAHSPAEQEIG